MNDPLNRSHFGDQRLLTIVTDAASQVVIAGIAAQHFLLLPQ